MTGAGAAPLLSVIIPTAGRPQWLGRAIQSALDSAPRGDVEVVVVPNGPDESWMEVRAQFAADARVQFKPIRTRHANAARNAGKTMAKGRYIRFLDDDDYLLPQGAIEQLRIIEEASADVCSGLVENVDVDGTPLGTLSMPQTDDFVAASTSSSGFTLPVGVLYSAASIRNCTWREDVSRGQDNVWMLGLAGEKEWHWVQAPISVGAWFQHDGARTSTVDSSMHHPSAIVDALFSLQDQLKCTGRLTPERTAAIASASWRLIVSRFPFKPLYWDQQARHVLGICPGSTPTHPLFRSGPMGRINPRLLLWVLLPVRTLIILFRRAKYQLVDRDYRRRL